MKRKPLPVQASTRPTEAERRHDADTVARPSTIGLAGAITLVLAGCGSGILSTPPATTETVPPPVSAPPGAASAPAVTPTPSLTKGGSYTVTTALNLRAGPSTGTAVLTVLNAGDNVVALGDEKGGFWAVTTAGGQSGWVWARDLKAN